jgi:hypothetical protein
VGGTKYDISIYAQRIIYIAQMPLKTQQELYIYVRIQGRILKDTDWHKNFKHNFLAISNGRVRLLFFLVRSITTCLH